MLEKLLLMVSHYGYFGLFIALVLGIVGLPIPDEVLMIFAGCLISKGNLNYLLTLFVSFLGSIAGMSVSYFIGHQLGLTVLEKYGAKIYITKEKMMDFERWFKRFGRFAVTIGYFIPGIRHITAYFSGISRWNYRTFFIYAALGAFIWAFTFVSLGTWIGMRWWKLDESIYRNLGFTLFFIAGGAAVIWHFKRR